VLLLQQVGRMVGLREGGLNTLDPFIIESLKNISMISMQNCIYLNSANQDQQ
jgi:hypothetical protein